VTAERTYEDDLHDILDHAEKAESFLTGAPSAEALRKDEVPSSRWSERWRSSERPRSGFRRTFNRSILNSRGEV